MNKTEHERRFSLVFSQLTPKREWNVKYTEKTGMLFLISSVMFYFLSAIKPCTMYDGMT